MRKFPRVLAAFLALLVFSLPLAVAETAIEGEGTPLRKLQRGFLNVALSPFEVSHELAKEVRTDSLPPGWVAGLGRGSAYAVGRALVGVYEMVTFAIPYPTNFKPVLQPEFPQQLGDEKPNF